MFNIGDLVKLNYSEHIGIVIDSSDRSLTDESQVYVYRIKWAVGEPYTWERLYNLQLVAGVNNEQHI
tara:strand:- start:611 stop:811 length:201 start_codon:yes stop_codon:yes gene_type:complete